MRLAIGLMLLSLIACGSKTDEDAGAATEFAVPVILETVERQDLSENLELVATLRANQHVAITAEVDGMVTQVGFAEGQRVKAGDLLFTLDDAKIEAEFSVAEAEFELASLNFERGKNLLRDKTINQQDYDQLEAQFKAQEARLEQARENVSDTRITAPFDGMMGAHNVSRGQFVTRGTMLADLVDLDTLKVESHVPERYIGRLSKGIQVRFKTVSFPDREFEGQVYFLAPTVDDLNRTLLIKAMVNNQSGILRPGMFGNLELTVQLHRNALTVSESAISFSRTGTNVMVVGSDGTALPRSIQLGLRVAGRAQVLEGLEEGEKVVIEGHQKLFPGAKVSAVEEGAGS